MNQKGALTLVGQGILRQLQTQVEISTPFIGDEATGETPTAIVFSGIWDTGATGTVITQAVIDQLTLKPTGQTKVHTANGQYDADTYLVNVILPSNIGLQGVTVTKGTLVDGADVLIGMDIITLGDFTITNQGGVTVMTFRVPSVERVDYVERMKEKNLKKVRNGK